MTPTNDKVDQYGADERLLKIADWLGSQVSMGQNSHDEPPEYRSQFDYELANVSDEIRSIAQSLSAPQQAVAASDTVECECRSQMLHDICEAKRVMSDRGIPVAKFAQMFAEFASTNQPVQK